MHDDTKPADVRPPSPGGYLLLPYLLATGFVLGILAGDTLGIPPLGQLFVTLIYTWIGVAVLHCLAIVAFRRSPVREVIVCEVICYLGLFGYVQLRMQNTLPAMQFLAAWSATFAGMIWLTWRLRSERWLPKVATFAGFFAVAMVAMQVYHIGNATWQDRQQRAVSLDVATWTKATAAPQRSAEDLPDVYYIVVDAYGREDVLAQLYSHDNSAFTTALRDRGFFVADQSRSNYHLTELSVASSLNMTHLPDLNLDRFRTRLPMRQMIQDSALSRFLSQQGYTTVAFASGKADTECRDFDHYISAAPALSVYQDVLLHTTAIPRLIDLTPKQIPRPADFHRQRMVKTLEQIPSAGDDTSAPAFVFAHLMSPHPPFVFAADGSSVDVHGQYLVADGAGFLSCYGGDQRFYRESYAEQLQHLNVRLLTMIDNILAHADRDAVIILQGDHGPRSEMDFENHKNANLVEGMGILNAVRLPAGEDAKLYASMTPVNTFRLLLNEYFATDLRLQEDRSYFETEPYTFVDVTEQAGGQATPTTNSTTPREPAPRVTLNQ